MSIFVIADPHFMHRGIIKHRPLFSSIEEHDLTLVENWNNTVSDNDEVFVLGDLSVPQWRDVLTLSETLAGTKYLVVGNHDHCFPGMKNGHKKVREYMQVFDSVVQSAEINFNGTKYLMSHFPYDADRGDAVRYQQWRLKDLGAPLIHGHTHSTEVISYSSRGTVQFCVSVDAWNFTPVNLKTIDRMFQECNRDGS